LPSLDLSIEHHLSSGLRRSSSESSAAAARRRSHQREHEREDDASERGSLRPVGLIEPLVGFDQRGWHRQVGQGWQRERREGEVLIRKFKNRN
jgi:hypothetical protein